MRYIVYLLLLGSIGFIVYQLFQFFLAINNGRSKMASEADQLREDLNNDEIELIPPTDGEWQKLSSYRHEDHNILTEYIIGHFETIHSEPIMHFARKTLMGSNNTVAVVRTAMDEVTFFDFDHETQIYLNGREWGTITSNNELFQGDHMTGHVIVEPTKRLAKTIKGQQVVSSVNLPSSDSNITYRAFSDKIPQSYTVESLITTAFALMH